MKWVGEFKILFIERKFYNPQGARAADPQYLGGCEWKGSKAPLFAFFRLPNEQKDFCRQWSANRGWTAHEEFNPTEMGTHQYTFR